VAAGDREALSELYDQTSPLVYGLALRILHNSADAEEVTLDVFTQVWRSAPNYDGRRGSVTAWLATLTRSRAIDCLRARAHRDRQPELDEAERSRPQPPRAGEGDWQTIGLAGIVVKKLYCCRPAISSARPPPAFTASAAPGPAACC
jgi:RNA polymerase sigma factor (sigma-70 family)